MRAIAQLLQAADLSVTQITERSGFQSTRGFNLCFKKIMGKTSNDCRLTR